jgi:hypothetical protein
MIRKKPYDGVVVAVRYTHQGEIDWVRAFERRGFVFSDRINLNRESLVERLKAGRRFKTGSRKTYQGSDFEVYHDIQIIENNGSSVIVVGQQSTGHDALGDLPTI